MNRVGDLIDLFSNLTTDTYAKLFYAKRREREAEARFRELIQSYKVLLQDQRYQKVLHDAEHILGLQLQTMVEWASQGKDCRALAERIKLLQEIVGEPLQMMWVESHRPKDEVDSTELAPVNGQA